VDPGVGSSRAALAVASEGRWLVGPDNGVLSPALLMPGAHTVSLAIPSGAAPTFHGRDVFAPAASALARGAALDALGPRHLDATVRRTPEPRRAPDGTLHGEVISVDRFGNAIVNLSAYGMPDVELEVVGYRIPLRRTYSDVAAGEVVALVGSMGLVEIAVRDGSAAQLLGLRRGAPVILRRKGPAG
jgi:S-adenosylmethionine hydrolase